MSEPKQYADRDHRALGDHYLRHVSAMTAEGLHAKSAIAAELAWRDERLAAVTRERDEFQRMAGANALAGLEVGRENDALRAEVERLQALVAQALDEEAEACANALERTGDSSAGYFIRDRIRARIAARAKGGT